MAADLDEPFQAVPWTRLSNTFKNTISISRRLGVRHVWIDYLDIV